MVQRAKTARVGATRIERGSGPAACAAPRETPQILHICEDRVPAARCEGEENDAAVTGRNTITSKPAMGICTVTVCPPRSLRQRRDGHRCCGSGRSGRGNSSIS